MVDIDFRVVDINTAKRNLFLKCTSKVYLFSLKYFNVSGYNLIIDLESKH